MSLQNNRNRSVCTEFLAAVESALVAKAVAMFGGSADEKALASAIVKAPAACAAKFAAVLSCNADVAKVAPVTSKDDKGNDTGNGDSYPVDDAVLTAAVDAAWAMLVAMGG